MRTRKLHFDESILLLDNPSLEEGIPELRSRNLLTENNRLALAALKVAMRQELTDRQRECIQMYYVKRMTMDKIGEELGIGKSTVCKHLQTARAHIRRVMSYAEAFQAAMDEDCGEEEDE